MKKVEWFKVDAPPVSDTELMNGALCRLLRADNVNLKSRTAFIFILFILSIYLILSFFGRSESHKLNPELKLMFLCFASVILLQFNPKHFML